MTKNYPIVIYEDAQFRVVHIGKHLYNRSLVFEELVGRDAMGHPVWQSHHDDQAVWELCRRLAQELFRQKDGFDDGVSSLDGQ